jgi:hypothetical protein
LAPNDLSILCISLLHPLSCQKRGSARQLSPTTDQHLAQYCSWMPQPTRQKIIHLDRTSSRPTFPISLRCSRWAHTTAGGKVHGRLVREPLKTKSFRVATITAVYDWKLAFHGPLGETGGGRNRPLFGTAHGFRLHGNGEEKSTNLHESQQKGMCSFGKMPALQTLVAHAFGFTSRQDAGAPGNGRHRENCW